MPRGGRNAKPIQLKVIQGTLRSDRTPEHEVKPPPAIPNPPPRMDLYARRAWRRLSPLLNRLGLLTEADAEMFFALCEAWGRWERARRRLKDVLRKKPLPVPVGTEPSGSKTDPAETRLDLALIRTAEVSVERAEFSFRQLATEFGMSPASRSRLDVEIPGESDFDGFLRRGQSG